MTTTAPALTWTTTHGNNLHTQVISHGLKDAKGREIGNYAKIEERSVWEPIPELPGRHRPTDRVEYRVATQATRDGEDFGAYAHGSFLPTLDEAKALAVVKIIEAGKRYAKAVAKGEGKQFKNRTAAV